MKHTKQNIIKLLEAIRLNRLEISNIYERNNKFGKSLEYLQESALISGIIKIIKDKDVFNKYCEIYDLKGE